MPVGTKRDTAETKQFQAEIIAIQKRLGWSNNVLANAIYCELNDEDDKESMQKFAETLKKQLQRSTTPVEILQNYLDIISRNDAFDRSNLIACKPTRLGVVDIEILRGVSAVAKTLIKERVEQ